MGVGGCMWGVYGGVGVHNERVCVIGWVSECGRGKG